MMNAEFESVIILSMNQPENTSLTGVVITGNRVNSRKFPEIPGNSRNISLFPGDPRKYIQFLITGIIQYGLEFDVNSYEQEWNIISNNSINLDQWLIKDSNITSIFYFILLFT